ncbi:sensor histidine kinase YesM [Halolactibacillus alkaliphilus]|uniref:histidine kinase n=1 Tax=Halolactibacillus alkaliphilus TaxID=442899 RepID=A0A511X2B3_9BACI|nr:sensor histidine kinase [Halolactibacillus alkaliphilus]GEN57080.1 sensor histidine kinase YesM [Halolactibacillus alkaliphilus]GGN71842.1 sensor histidine kinase YesM [Halolactibacillus alkaliphilus]SFO87090.1 two-component system, sensor histidine kinase YesM [Halolactibacillus alkaliphilus]
MSRFNKWNTLRNQILAVFLLAMMIVLLLVGSIIFKQVSETLTAHAKRQIDQTAKETMARYDGLIEQINLVSKQILTNDVVQATLFDNAYGRPPAFTERQRLSSVVNRIQANADGFYRVDIYTPDYTNLIPLDGPHLDEQVGRTIINAVNEQKGALVYIGEDPSDDNYFLFMRRISLLDGQFDNGGYMLIRIMRTYFRPLVGPLNHYTIVRDPNDDVIQTSHAEVIDYLSGTKTSPDWAHDYVITTETSFHTGFSVTLLTPIERMTEDRSFLLSIILISGAIGVMVFFVFSFGLSTYITKPIMTLTQAMKKTHVGLLSQSPQSVSSIEINQLNSTYNQLVEETNYLIKMVYEKELVKSQTELKALQAQIHPHFLFNTLNALYWSLDEKGEEPLAQMVMSMSNLFRYTIQKTAGDDWVTVEEEVRHLHDYMRVMQMRFGERFRLHTRIDPSVLSVALPKLMIQPFIENAVMHGLANKSEQGEVCLFVKQKAEEIVITIKDNGQGMTPSRLSDVRASILKGFELKTNGTGMALSNIRHRLELYYGPKYSESFTIDSRVNEGTTIRFRCPIKPIDKEQRRER